MVESCDQIDILVNNAGVIAEKPFLDITEAEWEHVLNSDLKSVFLCSQAVLRRMADRGRRHHRQYQFGSRISGARALCLILRGQGWRHRPHPLAGARIRAGHPHQCSRSGAGEYRDAVD
jgi:Short-chain dehydrogenases of various substrate specificities